MQYMYMCMQFPSAAYALYQIVCVYVRVSRNFGDVEAPPLGLRDVPGPL